MRHLRLKNATVGEILDRIASEYQFKQMPEDRGRIWYYQGVREEGRNARRVWGYIGRATQE